MTTYGYMRVSSFDQNEDRQLIELLNYGVDEKNIFMDKLSGKDTKRPAYQRLRRRLKPDDLVVFKSIDRLGRNYKDIQEEWRYITKEKKADIVILDMPILDTRTDKDLIGTLITDIVLQLLSYVAQVERENIRQRQAEGIAAAKLRGVRFGRPAHPIPDNFPAIYHDWRSKEITGPKAIELSGLTEAQFYWTARKYRKGLEQNRHSQKKDNDDRKG